MDVNHVICEHIDENIMNHFINNFNMKHYYCFELYN